MNKLTLKCLLSGALFLLSSTSVVLFSYSLGDTNLPVSMASSHVAANPPGADSTKRVLFTLRNFVSSEYNSLIEDVCLTQQQLSRNYGWLESEASILPVVSSWDSESDQRISYKVNVQGGYSFDSAMMTQDVYGNKDTFECLNVELYKTIGINNGELACDETEEGVVWLPDFIGEEIVENTEGLNSLNDIMDNNYYLTVTALSKEYKFRITNFFRISGTTRYDGQPYENESGDRSFMKDYFGNFMFTSSRQFFRDNATVALEFISMPRRFLVERAVGALSGYIDTKGSSYTTSYFSKDGTLEYLDQQWTDALFSSANGTYDSNIVWWALVLSVLCAGLFALALYYSIKRYILQLGVVTSVALLLVVLFSCFEICMNLIPLDSAFYLWFNLYHGILLIIEVCALFVAYYISRKMLTRVDRDA